MKGAVRVRALWQPAVVVGVPLLVNLIWLRRFRFGYDTNWDESGYISRGLNDTHALLSQGPFDLLWAYEKQDVEAPLVSLLAVPGDAVFGPGVFQSVVLLPVLSALLATATYALARRVVAPTWAAVAAFVVATMPVVTDYSREFVFAVPAALALTGSLWALLRADLLTLRRWVWLAGVLVGLLVLTRTMTVSFLPGLALVCGAQLLADRSDRRRRVLNLLEGAGLALVVAGSWYLRNWRSVYDYLTSSGYGSTAGSYGQRAPIVSWHYWTKELSLMANETYLPLGAALALCLLTAVVARRDRDRPRGRGVLASPSFALALMVGEGYLALTSSANEGTAFALPLLPALVVLALAAVEGLPIPSLRVALASVLVLLSIGNLLMKSGFVPVVDAVRTASLPALGRVAVTDGRSLLQLNDNELSWPAHHPLPPIHREWLPFARVETGWMTSFAAKHGERVYVVTASEHPYVNQTWVSLADSLWFHAGTFALWPGPARPYETAAQYGLFLRDHPENFVLTTSEPHPRSAPMIDYRPVTRALHSLRFRLVRTLRMPDGYLLWLWWRPSPVERV